MERVLCPGDQGKIGCDYFSANHKYLEDCDGSAQLCLAHFVWKHRFLKEHPDPKTL